MKTKTAEEIYNELKNEFEKGSPDSELNKICITAKDVIIYAMEEYKNQLSQLPASVTDEEIEKMLFAKIGARETMTEKEYLIGCIMGKMVRDLINHPPVIGDG